MGMCCSSSRDEQSSKYLKSKFSESIENNNYRRLETLIESMKALQQTSPADRFMIDDPITGWNDINSIPIELNCLGYALWCGSKECFVFLYEKQGASLIAMRKYILRTGKTPIAVICERGHFELLKYFLPIHLKMSQEEEQLKCNVSIEDSIFTEHSVFRQIENKTYFTSSLTPIQLAVERGHLSIVKYLVDTFANVQPPKEFDVNYQDETLGENCALVAVRTGNLRMIKYLYLEASANFFVLNKRCEDAVQIAAAWSKRNLNKSYLETIQYLVDIIRIDISTKYEEIMLVCEDRSILRYIEKVLRRIGIKETKSHIERKNRIVSLPRAKTEIEHKLDRFSGSVDFPFKKIFDEFETQDDHNSDISSITPILTRNTTPILSILANFEISDDSHNRIMN